MDEFPWPTISLTRMLHPLCLYATTLSKSVPFDAIQSGLALARLYASPEKAIIDPAAMLRDQRGRLERENVSLSITPTAECAGDFRTVITILRALRDALLPDSSTLVSMRLTEEKGFPTVTIEMDGPGFVSSMFCIEGYVCVSLTDIQEAWTLATVGGRIDRIPNGFSCKLRGVRKPRDPRPEATPWLDRFKAILAASSNLPEEALHLLHDCLDELEANETEDACDLRTVLREKQSAFASIIAQRDLRVDISIADALPPLLLPRNMLSVAVDSIFQYLLAALVDSGALSIVVTYDNSSRQACVTLSLSGNQLPQRCEYLVSPVNRLAVDAECIVDTKETLITFSLPDKVGRTLDEWLPGYEILGEQYVKMLRMLKGGACPFPEEFVLGGILEAGMTRWLLPCLDKPVVAYFAQDINPNNKSLPGNNADRMKKAFEQIRRGKVRKEIAEAQYAAEVIFAFAQHEKGRRFLSAEHLAPEELPRMAQNLLAGPEGMVDATRTLLRIIDKA